MSVGVLEGRQIEVRRTAHALVIDDIVIAFSDAHALYDLLVMAASVKHGEIAESQLVGSIDERVWVVRHPVHVGLHCHAGGWRQHSGVTMHPEQAQELAAEIVGAAA
jgi:hypothetical protein